MPDSADFMAGKHLGYVEGMLIAGSRSMAMSLMEPEIMPRIVEAAERFGLVVDVSETSLSIHEPEEPKRPTLTVVSSK